jgi:hypothetical protein
VALDSICHGPTTIAPVRSEVVNQTGQQLAAFTNMTDNNPHPDFRVDEYVASGTFGDVWKGTQLSFSRPVAIKRVTDEFSGDTSAIKHARALARLQHPNIVHVYLVAKLEFPDISGPSESIVMEWLEGETFFDIIKRGNLTVAEAIRIASGVISGVSYMHKCGETHSDVNFSNVLVGPDFVKIIDVGVVGGDEFARYSTMSKEERRIRDVVSAGEIARYCFSRCSQNFSNQLKFEEELRSAGTIEAVEEAFKRFLNGHSGDASNAANDAILVAIIELGGDENSAEMLKIVGKDALTKDDYMYPFGCGEIVEIAKQNGMSDNVAWDSLVTLNELGLLKGCDTKFARYGLISTYGFEIYLRLAFEPFSRKLRATSSSIVEGVFKFDYEFASYHEFPICVAKLYLRWLQDQGLCKIRQFGDRIQVDDYSPRLKLRIN